MSFQPVPKMFGCVHGQVRVWDVETLTCLKTLAGHTGPVRTLVCSAGHMFSGSYDKTVSSISCLPYFSPRSAAPLGQCTKTCS